MVGYAAIKADDQNALQSAGSTLVTSFKRVVGMTSRQATELRETDPTFWNSLPFDAVVIDDTGFDNNANDKENKQFTKTEDVSLSDVLGSNNATNKENLQQSKPENELQEGVGIQIPAECSVSPLQVSTILLESIRIAASDYLINNNRSKIQAPGLVQEEREDIQNCVIGVPAHYSHAQRRAIQNAAKNAGFTGQVSVMTESTAATLAYGHFVSPNIKRDKEDTESGGKNILVFDMGGGTTDCTITNIDFKDDNVQFNVVATSGDGCLGGDDVDELLARYIWKEHLSSQATEAMNWKASEHQDLISVCRCAKEELCGNDNKNRDSGVAETQIVLDDSKTITITREEFDLAIQQLIDRAQQVVDEALSVLVDSNQQKQSTAEIHEVVLVGGSTHVPTIRKMLSRKFPPPLELCTSIAETAVSEGLAIQAALLSKTVPLYELRNAMMLDVLPHSIGVWVQHERSSSDEVPFTKGQIIQSNNQNQGHYIEILKKDSSLPSMGSHTFTLANINQTGVTVIAAERIGPGDVYQCMGMFDFLLYRLHEKDHDYKTRQVKIGMTLDANGQFTVSIFDEKDPAHREKRRRYLKEKANDSTSGEFMSHLYEDEEDKIPSCSATEIALTLFCIIFFALYVAARAAFSDMTIEINEL